MNKLYMFGCSFSDRTRVSHCYGELAAEQLQLKYIHNAAGCGSNDRIFRVLGNLLADNAIDKQDTVVVQYTGVDRTEFWSNIEQRGLEQRRSQELSERHGRITLRERYAHGGDITRFKAGSWEWQLDTREAGLHKAYELNASFEPFNIERWRASHTMLQNTLAHKGIRTIFITPGSETTPLYVPMGWEFANTLMPEFADTAFSNTDILDKTRGWTLGNDVFHLSQEGHRTLGAQLAAHIKHLEKEQKNDQSWIHRSRQAWNALRRGNRR